MKTSTYRCDECGKELPPEKLYSETIRYLPLGGSKNSRGLKVRSTGRHVCDACVPPSREET